MNPVRRHNSAPLQNIFRRGADVVDVPGPFEAGVSWKLNRRDQARGRGSKSELKSFRLLPANQ
jgi:hypothetical protein